MIVRVTIWEIEWTSGLPYLSGLPHHPGVPHLHVNRPLESFYFECCNRESFIISVYHY